MALKEDDVFDTDPTASGSSDGYRKHEGVLIDPTVRVNEMTPEILAGHALNPFAPNNAPARSVMYASHFAQRLVISGSEPNSIQTGVEEEFGKYTFGIRMPEDGTILRVIQRYPVGGPGDTIGFNPETLVIYRVQATGVIDCFTIPYHSDHHPTFGFQYETKEAYSTLTPGSSYAKDTVFADSPAVKGESNYTYGVNLNVAYMSHPNVGLDGYVINRDALKHLKFKIYETRVVEFGANEFPINLYGDDQNYKAIPEIGDYIRDDGLVCVLRKLDPYFSPALVSVEDTQRIDHMFDRKVYSRPGVGRVVDMTVIHSDNVNRQLPEQMTEQLVKYSDALIRFHREIVDFEARLIREDRAAGGVGKPNLSEQFHRLIVESRAMIENAVNPNRQSLALTYRREPLDTWRVTIRIEYEVTPARGFKLTCMNGG